MTKLNQESLENVATIYVDSVNGETSWGDAGREFSLTIYNEETGEKWRGVSYSMGVGLTHEPTVEEVLWAVSMDAQAGEDSPTFEHFCYEYGYSEDSRSAYAIWKACREQYRKWVEFFTYEQREAISEVTGDM